MSEGQITESLNVANQQEEEVNRTEENAENATSGEEQPQQEQLTLMFYPVYDQTGQSITAYALYPDFIGIFEGLFQVIYELKSTVNAKWAPEQLAAYNQCLDDIYDYVIKFIWTSSPQCWYYEHFTQAMITYGDAHSVGFQLYQKQLNYLQKKSEGYDFRQDKKNKVNKGKPNKEEQKKPVQPIEKKEEVLIRTLDPQINIQKLMTMEYPFDKYISPVIFHKDNANLVFIGHVDAGKSTLTGNILKELNEVDQQEWLRNKQDAKENKMEAFELAGISDVDPSQRKDGKTREFAKLMFSLQKKRFTLFDAPGHKNYVPNMIMGACQADLAVLIISSKEGEFESGFEKDGQTKEHAMLAKALGVFELIVVVTKMGTVNWSQKRFNLIKEQVAPFLQNSCGFHNVTFIPVESLENQNVHTRFENSWYKGPCLLEYLDTVKLPPRTPTGPLRIPIIDKFKDVGNLFIYGKIQSGAIIEDQTVTILPSRKALILKEIYNAKDERLPFALAGENIKIRVKGIDESDIKRGDVVCNNLNYCQESSEFKAHITILDLPDKKKILSSGYECIIHMHALAEEVEIVKVEAKVDKETKKNIPATFLKTGESGLVTIKVDKAVCLEKHEFMASLGRFTLRDEGKTIGYGEVIKIKPAKTLLKEQKDQLLGEKKEEPKEEKKEEPKKDEPKEGQLNGNY